MTNNTSKKSENIIEKEITTEINQYIKNGYLPGESFLFTMESSLHPFDYDLFCDICERYLI